MNSTGKYPPLFPNVEKQGGVFSRKCSIPQNFPPAAGFLIRFEAFYTVFGTCSSPQAENFAKLSSSTRISTRKSLLSNWKSANFRLRRRPSELISDVEKQDVILAEASILPYISSSDLRWFWRLTKSLVSNSSGQIGRKESKFCRESRNTSYWTYFSTDPKNMYFSWFYLISKSERLIFPCNFSAILGQHACFLNKGSAFEVV